MKSAREKDEEMNLDSFLEIITRYYFVKLQIGSPASDIIRYHISGNQEGIERFCDIEFPFNNQNYTVISRLFNEIYGQNIESI